MSKTTNLGDEIKRERERRITHAPPETGAWYTLEYSEDDAGQSWDGISRLYSNPSTRRRTA